MPDGKTKALFHCIPGHTTQIGVCEGYSTAASVHEVTGHTVCVAFSCNNLEKVAVIVRAMHPTANLTVWADNDQWTQDNPGKTRAEWAAMISRAKVKLPDFTGMDVSSKPTDWNDFFNMKNPQVDGLRAWSFCNG
jgi:putative DNA primase/helicase